jgi:hypothetical protein
VQRYFHFLGRKLHGSASSTFGDFVDPATLLASFPEDLT